MLPATAGSRSRAALAPAVDGTPALHNLSAEYRFLLGITTLVRWTRSETIALARQQCSHCFGLGLIAGRDEHSRPCRCVFRQIFRIVYHKYRNCCARDKYVARVQMERSARRTGTLNFSFRHEEFVADFELLSRRMLGGPDTLAYRLFRLHFLRGADWKLCTRKLRLNRGEFFHEVYRIEEKLGRAYRETAPFALFPLDEYFTNSCHSRLADTSTGREVRKEPVPGQIGSFLFSAAA